MSREPDALDEIMVPANARAAAERVDNSVLGRFATPKDLFVAFWVFDIVSDVATQAQKDGWSSSFYGEALETARDECYALLEHYYPNESNYYTQLRIRTEMAFFGYDSNDVIDAQWFDRLLLIRDYPEIFHDYYAVGIWDVDVIESYITNGIDANLAASL